MGEDGKGTAYWYDGDSTIGHRLYKEITKVEFVKMKGKGRLTQPTNSYQWETLATNLEEFQQIFVGKCLCTDPEKLLKQRAVV
ncbi:hypothetical protein GIB67_031392 [Kingdonia uniflora]|uniref:Uncharacterized protein n=1 Tax=Kingdonia uniflora TaxID=39325 RepID=A0A7J7MBC2_9MAGN|nr:hypothetical protein GIB67_031392 [Kingdonia uniflora]